MERRLRAERPQPSDELVSTVARAVQSRPMPRRRSRVAFAGALTVMMLGSFASFGGLSYAATEASDTVAAVKRLAAGDTVRKVIQNSAAADQYKPKENKAVVIEQEAPSPGGVAGATSPDTDEVVEVTGTLPFTGISLTATAALSLMLVALGVFLRRRERETS